MYDFILKMKEIIKRIVDKGTDRDEKIEKVAKISYDGDQYLVRIPKEISNLLDIKKGDKIKFIVNIPYVVETDKRIMVVEVLD